MPGLTGTHAVLGDALLAAVDAAVVAHPEVNVDQRRAIWRGIAEAIIAHVVANATVSGPVTVASVSGVTPGPGVSGAGAGTLTGGAIT